jgi:diamine N-acetyltransferase
MITGENIFLRQVDPSDATLLLLWENNPENWKVSETEAPFSLKEIQDYIATASNIRANKQLRLIICINESNKAIGTVDLFDVDFKNKRAGVGILISNKNERQKGYASEALELMSKYASSVLNFKQLHCLVQSDNLKSISLFENQGFIKTGERKNWYYNNGKELDAYFYQKFL